MIVAREACARAGLIGNPSDGYFGKTISFAFEEFRATVTVFESPDILIELHRKDHTRFSSLEELVEEVRYSGYYGGVRLIKAAVKRFHDYAVEDGVELDRKNFTVRYDTNIPLRVGLAGSSAIITATLRALMDFYEVSIPKVVRPNLVLSVETLELGIPAGLQDRVAQVYQGLVHMDFSREIMEEYGHGRYEELDPSLLPPLYVAYMSSLSEGTEVFHDDIRRRFDAGDKAVRGAMREFARLTDGFRAALERGDLGEMNKLVNRNFDLRASIYSIGEANWRLINTARNCGVSAKFCGSGGAVVGICEDEKTFAELARAMKAIGAEVLRPTVAPPVPEPEEEES